MKQKFNLISLMILILLIFSSASTEAASVGRMTALEGRVDITRNGEPAVPASLNQEIMAEDIIRTKSDARAEVTFKDGSVVKFAPGTRMEISDFTVSDDATTGRLRLFRGKIQSLIPKKVLGLFGAEKDVSVETPTAICGVRGTVFFTYHQKGVTGAVFTEGEGYVYSLRRPDSIRTIRTGQAMSVPDPDMPPVVRDASAFEIEQHLRDTGGAGAGEDVLEAGAEPSGSVSGDSMNEVNEDIPVEQVIADALRSRDQLEPEDYKFTVDVSSTEAEEEWYYGLNASEDGVISVSGAEGGQSYPLASAAGVTQEQLENSITAVEYAYAGNQTGQFVSGESSGGTVKMDRIYRKDAALTGDDHQLTLSEIKYVGSYSPFDDATYDDWRMTLDFDEAGESRMISYEGSKWSPTETVQTVDGQEATSVTYDVAGTFATAWVGWQDCLTGVGGGELVGTYDPAGDIWEATGRGIMLDTALFFQNVAQNPGSLEALHIPAVAIGKTDLTGSGNQLEVEMRDVTFFSYSTGGAPRIWATESVSGTYAGAPTVGEAVPLSGGGLNADFTVLGWTAEKWGAGVNGSGDLSRTDNGLTVPIQFSGNAAGTYGDGAFSGTASGLTGN